MVELCFVAFFLFRCCCWSCFVVLCFAVLYFVMPYLFVLCCEPPLELSFAVLNVFCVVLRRANKITDRHVRYLLKQLRGRIKCPLSRKSCIFKLKHKQILRLFLRCIQVRLEYTYYNYLPFFPALVDFVGRLLLWF